MLNCKIKVNKSEGKVYLSNTGNESILFNKLLNIVGVSNFDKALEIYNVTQTQDFTKYNNSLIKQYRLDNSVVKTPLQTKGGFSEVVSPNGDVKIVYKEKGSSVDLELIESYTKGQGLARKFLQDFIYSFPNKDIELIISPRDKGTTFQGLATFYQSLGFDFKPNSSHEMIRYYNKGRLYPEGYDANAEPSVKHLMNFVNQQGSSKTTKKEVIQFMQASDITNSNELLDRLSMAEIEGIFIFSKSSLKKTGLFSDSDILSIARGKKKQEQITELLKYLRQNTTPIEVQPLNKEKVSSEFKKAEQKESEVVVNTILGDNVVPKKKRKTNVSTLNTISGDYNQDLSENISYVRRVSEEDWDSFQGQLQTLLKSIENNVKANGINLEGLTQSFPELTRQQVLDVLEATEAVLEGNLNVFEFDSILNQYLGNDIKTQDVNLGEDQVIVESELTEEEMFINFSLLKVQGNIYRNVNNQSLVELLNTNSLKTARPIEEIEQEVNKYFNRTFNDIETAKKVYLLKSNLNIFDEYIQPTNLNVEDVADWSIREESDLFTVNEKGVSFTYEDRALEAIEALPEYLKTEELNIEDGLIVKDILSLSNNLNLIEEFSGFKTKKGNSYIIKNESRNFLKLDGQLYELSETFGDVSVYEIAGEQKTKSGVETIDLSTIIGTTTNTNTNEILTEKELNKINEEHFNCQ